jgi:hypothetical protein
LARTASTEWVTPFTAAGGVIIANTGEITMNSNEVFDASVPLTINSGASLNTSASNFALTFGGDFVNNGGTFTANASAITIANTMATQSIAGFTTTGTVSMTKTAGTAAFTGNVNGGAFTLNGSGGTLDLGTGRTHTFTGALTFTNGTLLGNSSLLNIAGDWSQNAGTVFTPGSGTVTFNGTGAQQIVGTLAAKTFNNLTINKTAATLLNTAGSTTTLTIGGNLIQTQGDFTPPATMNITGSMTLTAGTFTVSGGAVTSITGEFNVGGTVDNSGTINVGP